MITPTRSRYAVEKWITDRSEADEACLAVLDVLDEVVTRAEVDAYSDFDEQMPEHVREAQESLRARGRAQRPGKHDPGMFVAVSRNDSDGWCLVRTYASWSINVALYYADGVRSIATLHDCGYSITAKLTPTEVALLTERLQHLSAVVMLPTSRKRWWPFARQHANGRLG